MTGPPPPAVPSLTEDSGDDPRIARLRENRGVQIARFGARGRELVELKAYFVLNGIEALARFSDDVHRDSLRNRITVAALLYQATSRGHAGEFVEACNAGHEAVRDIARDWKTHPSELMHRKAAQAAFYEAMERAAGCSVAEALRRQRLPHDL